MARSKLKQPATAAVERDPFPYHGQLRRIDGRAPYNHYLWPLNDDWYWANRHLAARYSSRFNFMVIALADGRWLSEGRVDEDESRMRFFASREAALRHAAAQAIRLVRWARKWKHSYDHVNPEDYVALVTWILSVVGRPAPRLTVKVPPPPPHKPPAWADLPLFGGAP